MAPADVRLMILIGALAGLRRNEIARFHTDCVTEYGLRIEGNGDRVRMIPLHPALACEIDAYRTERALTAGYFFTPSVSSRPHSTSHVGKLIGQRMSPGITPHKLRHRFASKSHAGTYNPRAVQELLGHSSPATTARYVATPEESLVAAVDAVPGIEGPEPIYHARLSVVRSRG
ncbi:hypothetical protein Back2_06520 [Nocardioides baekrokdamisoli]|uniref:Tyr recombinase domain-containing protein n=1 Tax=Nocardioides baekrokdamisoli TaxID=1804624 RepID=A0A3G9IJX5_9ACTN|nr:site-specific integrase [Nocardioides baekrokdamisoli]BBH16365.1 hypothetical protein Back2_06520 [Nocardioides baekrokdamisoli]